MSHNVSQTAFRSGKIQLWSNSQLELLSSLFWDNFKSYVVAAQMRYNRVSNLPTWYIIYYPVQFLWSLVGYPLRNKRRLFKWLFSIFKKVRSANFDGILSFIFKFFKLQYKIKHPIFLSIGKFGYAGFPVKQRVKKIFRSSVFYLHKLHRLYSMRYEHHKKFAERFSLFTMLPQFIGDVGRKEKLQKFDKIFTNTFVFNSVFLQGTLKKGLSLLSHARFKNLDLSQKRFRKIYWVWLRIIHFGEKLKSSSPTFIWAKIMRPHVYKYLYSKQRDLYKFKRMVRRQARGLKIKKKRGARKVILARLQRAASSSEAVKSIWRSRFNFWRKWRAKQLFDSSCEISKLINSDFTVKKINVFKYLGLNPRYHFKDRWKNLFWDKRFWRERKQYPAYFDLINSIVLQVYFKNLGFLFLQVICLILHKFNLKRGIVLFWFFNFLGTLVKELKQIKSTFSVFQLIFTGKVKGGTFRTSKLQAGFGKLARQSVSEHLQFYFATLNASAGLFGLKLLLQRGGFKKNY